jgi:hypothetical protein
VVVDALGVGAGTAGELIRRGLNVVPYKGGAASDSPGRWRNRRAQSYLCLRDALRDGKVVFAEGFPAWDHVCAEVCSVRTRPGQERVEELETKENMRRRGVKSPDRADGLAMAFVDHRTGVPAAAGGFSAGPDLSSAALLFDPAYDVPILPCAAGGVWKGRPGLPR